MKQIKLSNGDKAYIDDEDFDLLSKHKWAPSKNGNTTYAVTNVVRKGRRLTLSMHRLLLNEPPIQVDHKDGNGLNNCKKNLRPANRSQQSWNSVIPKNNTSGYKGVSLHKASGLWRAYICAYRKQISLGYFRNKKLAMEARKQAVSFYHGEFARQ